MRPSRGCNRLKAFRLYSLSSSTIRLASKRRIQVRVLLVDDDAAIARSIELMLKTEEKLMSTERTLARRGSTSEKSMTMTLYCST